MPHNFGISLENAVVAFTTYALALVAALSWNAAFQDTIKHHDNSWARWVYACGITLFAIITLTLVAMFSTDKDKEDSSTL